MTKGRASGAGGGDLPLRVLVVEDDPESLELIRMQLAAEGFEVLTADDGVDGLQAVLRGRPHLVLLDVMLPRLDGFQLCRILKNTPPWDRIPVFFLTVRTSPGDRQRGLYQGGDDWLGKPLDVEELRRKLARLKSTGAFPPDVARASSPREAASLSATTALNRLGGVLDESLYRLTLVEEIGRALAEADNTNDILRTLLVGCMPGLGLGFRRAVYLARDPALPFLRGTMALGVFPEAGVDAGHLAGAVAAVKDRTLGEVFALDLDSFPFLDGADHPLVSGLTLAVPDTVRSVDLWAPEAGGLAAMSDLLTAEAAPKLGVGVRAVPVTARGQLIGALLVDPSGRGVVSTGDLRPLLILCNQAGLALERCRLLDEQASWARELERLGSLHESVIQSAGVGIALLDPTGVVVTWNLAMARITGREAAKVTGRRLTEVFPVLADSLVARRFDKVVANRTEERVGHYRIVFGRRVGWFDVKLGPVTVRDELQGVVLLVEDITRRVRLEEKNQETFRYLSDVIQLSADAVITTDRRGRIRTWNDGATTIFGYPETVAKGRSIGVLFPRGGGREEILRRAASGETVRDLETTLLRQGGERFFAGLTASPLVAADGTLRAVSFFIRDVSERKKLVAQLVQTEKLASLGVMSAGMAHEINNPLASIVMHSQLLGMTTQLSPEAAGYLENIERETDRIAEIVNDLLVYSRAREKKKEWVDLPAILRQAVIFTERSSTARGITVTLNLAGEFCPLRGKSNEVLEMFLNLLLNALDAVSSGGSITVKAGMEDEGAGKRFRVVVEDTGHGIPAADLARIFDPFYTTKPPGKGTGLGLMVVSQLVTDYGGSIDVRSTVGKGTVFTILLPCRRDTGVDAE